MAIDFKSLDEFNTERIRILLEKYPKYLDSWKTIEIGNLKYKLDKQAENTNIFYMDKEKTKRQLIHIANYCYFLYTRLNEV